MSHPSPYLAGLYAMNDSLSALYMGNKDQVPEHAREQFDRFAAEMRTAVSRAIISHHAAVVMERE